MSKTCNTFIASRRLNKEWEYFFLCLISHSLPFILFPFSLHSSSIFMPNYSPTFVASFLHSAPHPTSLPATVCFFFILISFFVSNLPPRHLHPPQPSKIVIESSDASLSPHHSFHTGLSLFVLLHSLFPNIFRLILTESHSLHYSSEFSIFLKVP